MKKKFTINNKSDQFTNKSHEQLKENNPTRHQEEPTTGLGHLAQPDPEELGNRRPAGASGGLTREFGQQNRTPKPQSCVILSQFRNCGSNLLIFCIQTNLCVLSADRKPFFRETAVATSNGRVSGWAIFLKKQHFLRDCIKKMYICLFRTSKICFVYAIKQISR